MQRSKVHVYLHIVWGTYQRLPLVEPDIERRLYRNIVAQVRKCGCRVLAIGGVPDHVHMVVKLRATVAIAALLKQTKGVSSTFAREELLKGEFFSWHDRYSAFSVSRNHVGRVIEYVNHQKQHHAAGSVHSEWEEIEEEADDACEDFPEVDL